MKLQDPTSNARDFDKKWTLFNSILLRPFESFSYLEDIISLNFQTWYFITSSILVYVHRGSLQRGSHPIMNILADKQYWEVPQFGHVTSFIQLALISSTIPIHNTRNIRLFEYLRAKASPTPTGICAPTIPFPPQKLVDFLQQCIEPPLPLVAPFPFPSVYAMISLTEHQRLQA